MKKEKKLLPLFLNESLLQIVLSWMSIFSALFVYQRMREIASPHFSLAFVFFSFSIFGVGKIIGNCLAEESSLKRGLKFQLALGLVFRGTALLFFIVSIQKPLFLLLANLFWGLAGGTYWFGWHGLVGKFGTFGKYGRALGTSSLLGGIACFVAPITGGLLISLGGYQFLFLAAIGLLFLALLSLFAFRGEKTHRDTTPREVFRLFLTHKRAFLAYFSLGALGGIATTAFVLYLALILKNELLLGGFFSIAVLLAAVVRFFLGKLVDWRKRELLVVGSLIWSGVWLGRWLIYSVPLLLALNVISDLGSGMISMPLNVLTLEKAIDGRSTGRAILFRELAIGLGYLVIGLVLGIAVLCGAPLTFGFVLAVFLALTPILVQVSKTS